MAIENQTREKYYYIFVSHFEKMSNHYVVGVCTPMTDTV